MKFCLLALLFIFTSPVYATNEKSDPVIDIISSGVGAMDRGYNGAFILPRPGEEGKSDIYISTARSLFLSISHEHIEKTQFKTPADFLNALNSKKITNIQCYDGAQIELSPFTAFGNHRWHVHVCNTIAVYPIDRSKK